MNIALQASTTKTATATGTALTFGGAGLRALRSTRSLVFTLDIVSAVHTDETYDIYVTTSDGQSSWDVVHFPQIATTGAKRYTARVELDVRGENVTTASTGVAAVDSATLATVTAGSGNGIKTLTAGSVRNGPIGESLNHEIVIAGSAPSIVYSLKVEGR